jgi:hypothetical protein
MHSKALHIIGWKSRLWRDSTPNIGRFVSSILPGLSALVNPGAKYNAERPAHKKPLLVVFI